MLLSPERAWAIKFALRDKKLDKSFNYGGMKERAATGIMNRLNIFGLVAVTAMLVFYALEKRSPWFVLAFAGACLLASAYGFLQGAWPFGLVEAVWSAVAFKRWWLLRQSCSRDITMVG